MTSRRRKSTTGMTLFAFQDIIMSTSGIVIMIVLLLTLELVERNGEISAIQEPINTSELMDEVVAIKNKIAALQERLELSDTTMQTAATLSPSQLNQQIEELQNQNAMLDQSINALKMEMRSLALSEDQVEKQRGETRELQEDIQQLKQQQEQLKAEIEDIQRENRPVFTFPRGGQSSGWLVDVSEQKIEVAPFGQAAKPIVFHPGGGPLGSGSASKQFLKWVRSKTQQDPYFFFFVRPTGVKAFEEISESFESDHLNYGFDVSGADQTILNPDRGAVE